MATDFWASSHYKRWIVDRHTAAQARALDRFYVAKQEYLDFLDIYFANVITKLGKKLQFRQRVIATAIVFFRRFYLKNSYCETDPFTVIAACCYVAAKAEESPVHIKVVVSESRSLFSQEMYGVKHFSSDNTKLAEMEFYLVDDLECDLVVFHPYRTLLTLCRKESLSQASEEGEADEVGIGIGGDDGPRYWGTGEGQLELPSGALQTAWSIINDTYRSQLCVLYPPHLIAIAAIYLTFILHPPADSELSSPTSSSPNGKPTRRSSRQAAAAAVQPPKKPQDPIQFLAELNVSLPLIATIAQEIISLYTLWDRYREDVAPDANKLVREASMTQSHPSPQSSNPSPLKRNRAGAAITHHHSNVPVHTPSLIDDAHTSSSHTTSTPLFGSISTPDRDGVGGAATPGPPTEPIPPAQPQQQVITPHFLSSVLLKMREGRLIALTQAETLAAATSVSGAGVSPTTGPATQGLNPSSGGAYHTPQHSANDADRSLTMSVKIEHVPLGHTINPQAHDIHTLRTNHLHQQAQAQAQAQMQAQAQAQAQAQQAQMMAVYQQHQHNSAMAFASAVRALSVNSMRTMAGAAAAGVPVGVSVPAGVGVGNVVRMMPPGAGGVVPNGPSGPQVGPAGMSVGMALHSVGVPGTMGGPMGGPQNVQQMGVQGAPGGQGQAPGQRHVNVVNKRLERTQAAG